MYILVRTLIIAKKYLFFLIKIVKMRYISTNADLYCFKDVFLVKNMRQYQNLTFGRYFNESVFLEEK